MCFCCAQLTEVVCSAAVSLCLYATDASLTAAHVSSSVTHTGATVGTAHHAVQRSCEHYSFWFLCAVVGCVVQGVDKHTLKIIRVTEQNCGRLNNLVFLSLWLALVALE